MRGKNEWNGKSVPFCNICKQSWFNCKIQQLEMRLSLIQAMSENKKLKSDRCRRSGGGSTSERLMVPPWKDCETSSTEKGMLEDTGKQWFCIEDSRVIREKKNRKKICFLNTLNRRLARMKGKSCWLNLPTLVFSSAWSPIYRHKSRISLVWAKENKI